MTVDIQTAELNGVERAHLGECEAVIERGMKTFYEVGTALADIRDRRLYRAEYRTFEEYVEKRWQMSKPRAYELMVAAGVVSGIPDTLPKPNNAGQAAALARVPEDQRLDVWQRVVDETDGKPTAAAITKAATRPEPDVQPEPEIPHANAESATCEQCGGPMDAGQYGIGYMRCDGCDGRDEVGVHIAAGFPKGRDGGCVLCAAQAQTAEIRRPGMDLPAGQEHADAAMKALDDAARERAGLVREITDGVERMRANYDGMTPETKEFLADLQRRIGPATSIKTGCGLLLDSVRGIDPTVAITDAPPEALPNLADVQAGIEFLSRVRVALESRAVLA